MRKKLFLLLLSVILITAAVISVVIGKFSYDFVSKVLRENMEEKILRIEKQLDHYDSILHSIETRMDRIGEKALYTLHREIPDRSSALRYTPDKLKSLAKRAGVGEIYFLGDDGRVFNSSLKKDIGLNLLGISPAFTRYINSIYGRGEIISQGISVSINEGKIFHYMYYSPKNSRIIYEISMDVQAFVQNNYNFPLYEFLFSDMFKNFYNDYLVSLDIYSISAGTGWSLINSGKKFIPDSRLLTEIVNGGEVVIEKGDRVYFYRQIKTNKYVFNRASAVYVELIYDVSILSRYLRKIILYAMFSCVIITGIIFLITTMKINNMFIRRMSGIIESLKSIKNGDYSVYISDDSRDEISDISSNINLMTRTIQHRTDELNRTNEQLREMTVFISDIIDSMPSALISINEKGRIIQWNKEAENLSGVRASEAVGNELWGIIPQLYKYRSKCEEVRQKRAGVEFYGESYVVEKSGKEEVYLKNIYIFPFSKEQITGVIIRIDDVTELVRKEEQLERAKRAEVLGTMAGGLAHDFNNIIAGIVSTASYLDVVLSGPGSADLSEIKSHLNVIRSSGEKAASLVKNLMSFSRENNAVSDRIDLSGIITGVSDIVASTAVNGIEFFVNPGSGGAFIYGDRTQLEQVILNLVVNAAEAIKGANTGSSGRISLQLEKTSAKDLPLNKAAGPLWRITISDNGPGIARENLERIFDPFFTTKKEGNGLGLAIVNTIITRHEGVIEVHSEKGRGTTFTIYLPAAE